MARVHLVFGKKYRDLAGPQAERDEAIEAMTEQRFGGLAGGGIRLARHISDTEQSDYDDEYQYKRGLLEEAA